MHDPQDPSRRKTIKYLITGAVTATCPIPTSLFAAEVIPKHLGGEENTICHQVRDGATFKLPAASAKHDVVIVGGGPSGLMSAYKLHNADFLLLEKEPRFGGNAISEQWQGVWYSTGAAYQMDDEVEALCRELGMEIHRIRSVDAAIIHDQLVPEFWGEGLWKSPYPEVVKKSWAQFFKDMKALDTEKNAEKLDNMTFAELLDPYHPELKDFFDNFGPNNWGAPTEGTSALVGAQSVTWGGGLEPNRYTWSGGLGMISRALEQALNKSAAGKLKNNATVVQIEPAGSKVNVSYSENGELKTVAAKTVIIACPKFIAKKLIRGLDEEHREAMEQMHYQPYMVVNVCFSSVIYNGSYDTNVPAPSPIVDFNVADWVINRDNKILTRPSVLTCYVPRPESERSQLLDDAYVMRMGDRVVTLLDKWFPGSRKFVEEVHIYRRGHPMFVSGPGMLTRVSPLVRKPMGNIFFAHSDSEGAISEYSTALRAADRCTKDVMAYLNQKAKATTSGI